MDTNQKVLNLNKYPNNEILAKRLAQCLNKDLPGGLHEVSIKLYSFVLHLVEFLKIDSLILLIHYL